MSKHQVFLFIVGFIALGVSALSLPMDTSRGDPTDVLDNIDISGYVCGDKKVSKSSQLAASANFMQALENGDCKEMERIWSQDDFEISVLLSAFGVKSGALSGLYKAITGGNLEEIRKIINVNSTHSDNNGDDNETPLCWACRNNETDMVRMFLPYCTNETINKSDARGFTPLLRACHNVNLEIVKLLLPHCTLETINRKTKCMRITSLCEALTNASQDIKRRKILRLLLENGAHVSSVIARTIDYESEEVKSLIHLAIGYDRAQNKIQFLEAQKKDDCGWLIKRHSALSKSQTLFSNISKDNKYKNLKDCTIITKS